MTFRDSLHNLIRSDRPDSPTDVIFLFGSLVLLDLWIYATLTRCTVPHITELIGFLVLCKGVKVASDKVKGVQANAPAPPPVV